MEVHHKSTPWRGWREFLREYVIIVVGVLTALGGEQIVARLHRDAEVAEARQALRLEIADNAATARFSIENERCFSARLDQYVALASGGPRPPPLQTGGLLPYSTSAWAVVKTGAAALMPLKERMAYSRFYDLIDSTASVVERQRDVFLRLGGYRARTVLDQADAQRILEDTNQGRVLASIHSSASAAVVRSAQAIGVGPSSMSADQRAYLQAICSVVGLKPNL
jgi:hypothetical protein